jgi:hypothetical protein
MGIMGCDWWSAENRPLMKAKRIIPLVSKAARRSTRSAIDPRVAQAGHLIVLRFRGSNHPCFGTRLGGVSGGKETQG